MAAGEVNLADVLEEIQSTSVETRKRGFANLKHVLETNKKTNDLRHLRKEKVIHPIFEVLARTISKECATYTATTRVALRNASASRLSSYASAFRYAVGVLTPRLRVKTLKLILSHLFDVLPVTDEGFCKPLATDYIKALRSILAYPAHVEHLKQEDWFATVDFCLAGINDQSNLDESDSSISGSFSGSRSSGRSALATVSRASMSNSIPRQHQNDSSAAVTGLLACLASLCRGTNASLLPRAEVILESMINLLRNHVQLAESYVYSFQIINAVLERLIVQSESHVTRFLVQIIPLMGNFWLRKGPVRDQMLITLTLLQVPLSNMLGTRLSLQIASEIEELYDEMRTDFFRAEQRDRRRLQFDDLASQWDCSRHASPTPFHLSSIALSWNNVPAEYSWCVLYFLGGFSGWLDKHSQAALDSSSHSQTETPRKRRKIASKLYDTLQQTITGQKTERLCALQILAFSIAQASLSVDQIQDVLDTLIQMIADSDGELASWALVAASECATLASAKSAELHEKWQSLWQVAFKAITSTSHCPASCHLLNTLALLDIVDSTTTAACIQIMLNPSSMQAPALLCDFACLLWETLLEIDSSTAITSRTSRQQQGVLSWLLAKWQPSDLDHRSHATYLSRSLSPWRVTSLMGCATLRKGTRSWRQKAPSLGIIGRSWLLLEKNQMLMQYIYAAQTHVKPDNLSQEPTMLRISRPDKDTAVWSLQLETTLADYTEVECRSICERFADTGESRHNATTQDMTRAVVSFCLIMGVLVDSFVHSSKTRQQSLRKGLIEALKLSLKPLTQSLDLGMIQDAVLDILAGFVPDIEGETFPGICDQICHTTVEVICEVDVALRRVQSAADDTQADFDDVRIDHVSQRSHHASNNPRNVPRTSLGAYSVLNCFHASTKAMIHMLAAISSRESRLDDTSQDQVIISVVELITDMPTNELICSSLAIKSFVSSSLPLGPNVANSLLRHYSTFIATYDHERSEASLLFGLMLMDSFVHTWTTTEGDSDVTEIGSDLYSWFVEAGIEHHACSSTVESSFAELLFRLLRVNPDYGPSIGQPSIRTTLFDVLRGCILPVKFNVIQRLPEVFGMFVLSQHEAIFHDVRESLPRDVDWKEGMALRLLAMSRIAAKWNDLMRRCVYAIFETAGHVSAVVQHATRCISDVAKAYEVSSLELFVLFCPQIIYTWLQDSDLKSMPYSVFGFTNLATLLEHCRGEVTAQLTMLGKDNQLRVLSQELNITTNALLLDAFSLVISYNFAKDASTKGADGMQSRARETSLRNTLSEHKFLGTLQTDFPIVVGHFFQRFDGEDQVERALQARSSSSAALQRLQYIKSLCSSAVDLGGSQQPSFKGKYFLDQIERTCRRTNQDPSKMWTPYLTATVARMLLDDLHPALGSLHACRIIRKLRILISLADCTNLGPYLFQQILHRIRPLLTDIVASDDAIGVFQYLLEVGKHHVEKDVSFLGGIAISTFLSLRGFLVRPQDSLTQGSQRKAAMDKTENLHRWLAAYTDSLRPVHDSHPAKDLFRQMIHSAKEASVVGNAVVGSAECSLLTSILQDMQQTRPLLSKAFRNGIVSILCQQFELPVGLEDNSLSARAPEQSFAPELWHLSKLPGLSTSFRIWTAWTVGRYYADNGPTMRDVIFETRYKECSELCSNSSVTELVASKVALLRIISDLVFSQIPRHAALAEQSCRDLLTKELGDEREVAMEDYLPFGAAEFLTSSKHHIITTAILPKSSTADLASTVESLKDLSAPSHIWIKDLTIALTVSTLQEPILAAILPLLFAVPDMPGSAFPFVLHLFLLHQSRKNGIEMPVLTDLFNTCLEIGTNGHRMHILNAVLYLRSQPKPQENTTMDRNTWLMIDLELASRAAADCGMYKTATLLLEISSLSSSQTTRRSSKMQKSLPNDLMLKIAESIDEPDAFYGVEQSSTLGNIARRMMYEGNAAESLLLQGAQLDVSAANQSDTAILRDGVLTSLNRLNLDTLVYQLSSDLPQHADLPDLVDSAVRLQRWDISAPSTTSQGATAVYETLQAVATASDFLSIHARLEEHTLLMFDIMQNEGAGMSPKRAFCDLAAVTEVRDVLAIRSPDQAESSQARFENRLAWMQSAPIEAISRLLTTRGVLWDTVARRESLHRELGLNAGISRMNHIATMLSASSTYREQGALQDALHCVTRLDHVIEDCKSIGLSVDASVTLEVAQVLWDRGELLASIRMLQSLQNSRALSQQSIMVERSRLLAVLGHQVSDARLEKPDDILKKYLHPAYEELKGVVAGPGAGKVFHELATYCHGQLPDFMAEIQRSEKFQRRKTKEIKDLKAIVKSNDSSDKAKREAKRDIGRGASWLKLDQSEYQRLRATRQQLLVQSLENYLRSLAASDEHDKDVLRFLSLWLEHADEPEASSAVSRYIETVPSRKFATLMNQLASRLQNRDDIFHRTMSDLVERICHEHPYHSMYHIFAGWKTSGGNDPTAQSRNAAAEKLSTRLKNAKQANTARTWRSIYKSCELFVHLAGLKSDSFRAGAKCRLSELPVGKVLEKDIATLRVPPITDHISLRDDLDYSSVPTVTKFQPYMTIAGGLSAPKIVTAVTSDGKTLKQLYKSGSDDLRQDAIMEQVFEQGSSVLRLNKATRQRDLKIRTYKVIPLTATAGAIEFVDNTISLNEFLIVAHERYNPTELKWNACRKKIQAAEQLDHRIRVETYRDITRRFSPVLRHFFFERFLDPEVWFAARLAYTRSTAAISILGYILGLGDRHCQNILLDQTTGEVIHIDLGVAFEAGRVLNVPEVVPFRLTRDIVDGFGAMKTEGVFRRSCEFAFEAFRRNKDIIMTVLNVLRYDPLYQWSMSPLRAKKLQEDQDKEGGDLEASAVPSVIVSRSKRSSFTKDSEEDDSKPDKSKDENEGEGGEADRALSAVQRKLAPGLSVSAAVNELIQQATDEQNLAVLFCGWAAYA